MISRIKFIFTAVSVGSSEPVILSWETKKNIEAARLSSTMAITRAVSSGRTTFFIKITRFEHGKKLCSIQKRRKRVSRALKLSNFSVCPLGKVKGGWGKGVGSVKGVLSRMSHQL